MMDEETGLNVDAFPVMRRRKAFACPHCGEMCSLPVAIQILEPMKFVEENPEDQSSPYKGLSDDQRAIVELAESNGVLKAFEEACARRTGAEGQRVKRPGRFFLSFLKMAGPKRVPPFVLQHYKAAFPYLQIDFWGNNGVLAVVAGGKIRAFLPTALAVGQKVLHASGGHVKGRLMAAESEFQEWVKTRHGYVPSDSQMFLKELQKRSIGEFVSVRL